MDTGKNEVAEIERMYAELEIENRALRENVAAQAAIINARWNAIPPAVAVIQLEGAVIHDVDLPAGLELHIIDVDARDMEPEHPYLCRCKEYGDGTEHDHTVWTRSGNTTVRAPFTGNDDTTPAT